MSRLFFAAVLFLYSAPCLLLSQSVKINEVVAANTQHHDEDGDSPDWLELRNFSSSSVSLTGWQLTDDLANGEYWAFPETVLEPDGHLRIWASGKDRRRISVARTFLTWGDQLRYLVPTQPVSDDWKSVGFNDNSWLLGSSGFGYNDGDDATQVPGGTGAIFVRSRFNVSNPAAIERLILDVDYDDAFVAYLNGTEIARANIVGDNPPFNAFSITDREAEIYRNGLPERYVVEAPQPLLSTGSNVISIQVHNVSNNSSDLSLIPFLSAVYTQPTEDGRAPDVLMPIPVAALHTDFKISSAGDTLYLLNPEGVLVDSLITGTLPVDVALGIPYNDADRLLYFDTPTPGTPNPTQGYEGVVSEEVVFSHPGGTTSAINLSLSSADASGVIRYTTDATEPTENSPEYMSPLFLSETTVVRARKFKDGYLPGVTQSRVYIIGASHDLPIVSLITEPENLFDEGTGIYVLGNNHQENFPFFGANFWEDWERPVHVSLFEKDGALGTEFNGGVKIFGGWSRALEQRSFSIFARREYGPNEIAYPLFSSRPYENYQAFILRNGGNDLLRSNMRDRALTSLMEGSGLEVQANRPAIAYLNGEYWGLYNLREKVNEHFIGARYGLASDEINIAELSGQAIHGDNQSYLDLVEFVTNNSLASTSNYNHVAGQIDIENYIIYNVAQIYFNNTDWPGNNIKFWQPVGGKWRWILFDTDFGFGIWNEADYFNNTLAFALETNGPNWPNPPWSTLLFRRLMANTSFRNAFVNRYADELNSRFLPERVRTHIDTIADQIRSEIPSHFNRWETDVAGWQTQIDVMTNFGNRRHREAKRHVRNTLNLAAFHQLTIRFSDTNEGFVRINDRLLIDEDNWKGDYFEGVPFAVEAVACPGHVFSHWESSQSSEDGATNPLLSIDILAHMSLQPVFVAGPDDLQPLVINEINYNSSPSFNAGDWIELYNPNNFSVDISDWVIKDDDDAHEFIVPEGTMIAADDYLIITRSAEQFGERYPHVDGVVGDFDFGLSGNGDAVRLFNAESELEDEVNYLPTAPWPLLAAGQGPTLELIRPVLDNRLPENWVARTGGFGTPGRSNLTPTSTIEAPMHEFRYYPNPSTGRFTLSFTLERPAAVRAALYDSRGVVVHKLAEGGLMAGPHTFSAQLDWLSPGMYFLEVRTDQNAVIGERWRKE